MRIGRRRKRDSSTPKFGWCMAGMPGTIPAHEKRTSNGERVEGTCPGTITAMATTANYTKGETVHCGCEDPECHRQFQDDPTAPRPEPWPGYFDSHGTSDVIVSDEDDDEETDDEDDAGDETEAESDNPTAEDSESASEPLVAFGSSESITQADTIQATDVHEIADEIPGETRRIWYKEGWVIRTVHSESGRGGKERELVKWTAWRRGVQVADEWSLKLAKAALLELHARES